MKCTLISVNVFNWQQKIKATYRKFQQFANQFYFFYSFSWTICSDQTFVSIYKVSLSKVYIHLNCDSLWWAKFLPWDTYEILWLV